MRGVYRGIFRVKKTLTQQICIRVFGADERNRTVDLLITNELLYQLSYIGVVKNYIRHNGIICLSKNGAPNRRLTETDDATLISLL